MVTVVLESPRLAATMCAAVQTWTARVAYLASRWNVLQEFRLVQEVTRLSRPARAAHPVAVLRGHRPKRCGSLATTWQPYEDAGCFTLGRAIVWGRCPRARCCPWPRQLTHRTLEGKRVIFAVQGFLAALPQGLLAHGRVL
jgi:hypothetical protein